MVTRKRLARQKKRIKHKKPYFIPEPFGLPFELQPKGKFRRLKKVSD